MSLEDYFKEITESTSGSVISSTNPADDYKSYLTYIDTHFKNTKPAYEEIIKEFTSIYNKKPDELLYEFKTLVDNGYLTNIPYTSEQEKTTVIRKLYVVSVSIEQYADKSRLQDLNFVENCITLIEKHNYSITLKCTNKLNDLYTTYSKLK